MFNYDLKWFLLKALREKDISYWSEYYTLSVKKLWLFIYFVYPGIKCNVFLFVLFRTWTSLQYLAIYGPSECIWCRRWASTVLSTKHWFSSSTTQDWYEQRAQIECVRSHSTVSAEPHRCPVGCCWEVAWRVAKLVHGFWVRRLRHWAGTGACLSLHQVALGTTIYECFHLVAESNIRSILARGDDKNAKYAGSARRCSSFFILHQQRLLHCCNDRQMRICP